MQKVPYDIWSRYDAFLKAKVKDVSQHENLKKWFLYFWDFLAKYHPPDSRSEQIRLFIEKLKEKKQSQEQQKQAAYAVSLYFQMQDSETRSFTTTPAAPSIKGKYAVAVQERINTLDAPLQVSEPATHFHSPSQPCCSIFRRNWAASLRQRSTKGRSPCRRAISVNRMSTSYQTMTATI